MFQVELTPCHMIDTTDSGTHTTGCRTCSLVFNPSIFPLLHQWGSGICTQELITMTGHIILVLQADVHKVAHYVSAAIAHVLDKLKWIDFVSLGVPLATPHLPY